MRTNSSKAEECLTEAWNLCHKDAMKNKECVCPGPVNPLVG